MNSKIYIPHLQVRHNSLVFYELPDIRPPTGLRIFSKAYTGKVSSAVDRRIRKAVDILIQKSPPQNIYNPVIKAHHAFTLGFVTLTISDNTAITGKEAHRLLLRPFLRRMRTMGRFSYIWKAEFQKRGQLHYHITWNRWIHYDFIKREWNKLQRKAGLLQKFGLKHGHYNPNSTDVHSVYRVKDIGGYLSKYLSKSNSKALKGKVWDCSRDLKIKRFNVIMENENDTLLREAINRGEVEMIEMERCVIFRTKRPLEFLTKSQRQLYSKWL